MAIGREGTVDDMARQRIWTNDEPWKVSAKIGAPAPCGDLDSFLPSATAGGVTVDMCDNCGWNEAAHIHGMVKPEVPAPPTRTEEPETLWPRLTGLQALEVRQAAALCYDSKEAPFGDAINAAMDRLVFVESERDRLREQIETHRTWLRAVVELHPSDTSFQVAEVQFNNTVPPERP